MNGIRSLNIPRLLRVLLYMILPSGIYPMCVAAEPLEELKSFSGFRDVDLEKLAEGDILASRGSLMSFSRGISVQTCYVVMASMDATVRKLQIWDPTRHPDLKFHQCVKFHSPSTQEDFQPLNLESDKAALCWLVDKTWAATPEKSDLQISRTEAAFVVKRLKENTASISKAEMAARCWRDILRARALKFQKEGLAAIIPYEMEESIISPAREIQSLLKGASQVGTHFSSLLTKTPLMGNNQPSTSSVSYYWELFEVNGHGTLDLGVTYVMESGTHTQLVDCQFYASGGYYTSLTLYQFWPVQVDGRPATLVWRGDFLSAPSLTITRGVERMAYGGIMLQEIKKAVRFFLEDLPSLH